MGMYKYIKKAFEKEYHERAAIYRARISKCSPNSAPRSPAAPLRGLLLQDAPDAEIFNALAAAELPGAKVAGKEEQG